MIYIYIYIDIYIYISLGEYADIGTHRIALYAVRQYVNGITRHLAML